MIQVLIAVGVIVAVGIVMAIVLAFASKYLYVAEDPRKEVVLSKMPGANCGGCGFPGCAGLVDAFIEGKVSKITTCAVLKKEKAEEISQYLNETPDASGNTLKTSI